VSFLAEGQDIRNLEGAKSKTTAPTRRSNWAADIRRRLLVTDFILIGLTVSAAQLARFGLDDGPAAAIPSDNTFVSIILAAAWLGALGINQSRAAQVLGTGNEEYKRVITGTLSVFGILAIVSALLKFDIARGYLAIALPLGMITLLGARKMWRTWLVRQRRKGNYSDPAVLVGHRADVAFVASQIQRLPAAGYRVVGAILDEFGPKETQDPVVTTQGLPIPVVGSLASVVTTVQELDARAVIVAGQVGGGRYFLKSLGWELEKTRASLVLASRLTDIAGPRIHWRPVDGLPLMSVELPQYRGARHTTKRVMDVVLSGLGLLFLSPIFAVVALCIYREDQGPVYFRQPRVGILGQEFIMHKFRTMNVDADEQLAGLAESNEGSGALFKIRDDPRVTNIGKFLRRYSIDELPQLWDVFRGKMSMIGPRPPLPREVELYEDHIHRRLNVRPGITGLWQVSGRSDLSWEESVRLDLYYVENWSPAGDLVILAKTVRAVISKEGAY
jgi:exopolysaccharide biosynthesis polyprenyl glycosylphosphotransferase